ncbi:MAG: PTS sugar transporter subunit IIA [Candidatus Nanohaloarchaea archaeon]
MENASLDDIIDPGLVDLDVAAGSKQEAIDHLLEMLSDAGRVDDPGQARADVLEREEEATTGVGMGVAIPHAKTAAVDEPVVGFIRSEDGVDFDAVDGTPATLIFMLLFPEDASKGYLKTLSTLSRALVHEEVRADLADAATPGDVIAVLREAIEE